MPGSRTATGLSVLISRGPYNWARGGASHRALPLAVLVVGFFLAAVYRSYCVSPQSADLFVAQRTTLLACWGMLLGIFAPGRVRKRWPFAPLWTGFRLQLAYQSVQPGDSPLFRLSEFIPTSQYCSDPPVPQSWSNKYCEGVVRTLVDPSASYSGDWTHLIPLLVLELEVLQMSAMALLPRSDQMIELGCILINSATFFLLLVSAGFPRRSLSRIPFYLLARYVPTAAVLLLTWTIVWIRTLAYKLAAHTTSPAPALDEPAFDSATSAPAWVESFGSLVVERLSPGHPAESQPLVDTREGFSRMIPLGPANNTDEGDAEPPSDLALRITSRARVRPADQVRSDVGTQGLQYEVRNLHVVPDAESWSSDPLLGSGAASGLEGLPATSNDKFPRPTLATFVLLYRLYRTYYVQAARLWTVISWLVLERCRAPLHLDAVPLYPQSRSTPEVDHLLIQLAGVQEEEAWMHLPAPPQFENLGRGLRLFWSGRLGEAAYQLNINEEQQRLLQRRQHLREALERTRGALDRGSDHHPDAPSNVTPSSSSDDHILPSPQPQPQPSKEREHEAQDEGHRACVVCYSSPRSIVLWPCRCVNMCDGCRVNMALMSGSSQKALCPTCRTRVLGFSRLYFP